MQYGIEIKGSSPNAEIIFKVLKKYLSIMTFSSARTSNSDILKGFNI